MTTTVNSNDYAYYVLDDSQSGYAHEVYFIAKRDASEEELKKIALNKLKEYNPSIKSLNEYSNIEPSLDMKDIRNQIENAIENEMFDKEYYEDCDYESNSTVRYTKEFDKDDDIIIDVDACCDELLNRLYQNTSVSSIELVCYEKPVDIHITTKNQYGDKL